MHKSAHFTVSFLGAAETVTGSRYLVESDRSRVLVDCGLFQGYKKLRERNWASPGFTAASVDAVVLTHAHLDHSGYLPCLLKAGFAGPVYCTPGTRDLLGVLLPDAGHLQEEEAKFAARAGFSKHATPLPLFTREEAKRCLDLVQVVSYGMATGGRVLHHLKRFLPDPRNTILLVGYQASGTRGRSLADGSDELKIHGQYVPVRAQIRKLDGLSAHADYVEIIEWLQSSNAHPHKVFVTHGEPAAADALRRRLRDQLGWDAVVPDHAACYPLPPR